MKTRTISLFACLCSSTIFAQSGVEISPPLVNTGNCTACDNSVTIGIQDAAADGSTKGAASFNADDFNAASGVIEIDYENGQKADADNPGFVSDGEQVFGGDKSFSNKALFSAGSESAPSAAYSGNSELNGLSFNNNNIFMSFNGTYKFGYNTQGTFNITNIPDGSFISGLTLNIHHDADEEMSPQDGGVNVSVYAGNNNKTATFGGRTASGTWNDIQSTETDQRLAEFIGKGYANGDWEPSNRGTFGIRAAQNHTENQQGAYCYIKTTTTNAFSPPENPSDHMSFLVDPEGNTGLTYSFDFNTSLPYGWGGTNNDRFFSIENSNTDADAGILIQNGTTTNGGSKGLNIWLDNSANISYFDNITNDNAAYMYFRLKTLATANSIAAMSLTTSGIAIGGNTNIFSAPSSALHIDKGNATSSDLRFTSGTTTGVTTSDGFSVGITTAGDAEFKQRENLKIITYTNNTTRLFIQGTGEIGTGSTQNNAYRTTNTSSSALAHILLDPASSITSGYAWGFDATNGFLCTQGNGTRRIQGMSIRPVNTTNTLGSEAMAMGFFTQSGGTAATEKFRIESDGRLYGTALHNNSGAITGTTNQYIASGTYSPSITNLNNISSASATETQWIRVGNVVTISGRFIADPTAPGSGSFEISLPIETNIVNAEDCAGVAFSGSVAGQGAEILGATANDKAKIQWIVADTSEQHWSYTYNYEIK